MATLAENPARAYMHKLLAAMSAADGSGLFIADDFPPGIEALGMRPLSGQKLTGEIAAPLAHARRRSCSSPTTGAVTVWPGNGAAGGGPGA